MVSNSFEYKNNVYLFLDDLYLQISKSRGYNQPKNKWVTQGTNMQEPKILGSKTRVKKI
jgi:hypothetical protein